MALSTKDREEISETIRLVVNGNIKRVEGKLDAHIDSTNRMLELYSKMAEELGPVREGVAWINSSKKFVLWVAATCVAIGSILSAFK